MFKTKLRYKETPEKDNSTIGISDHTNGKKKVIFCFRKSFKYVFQGYFSYKITGFRCQGRGNMEPFYI